jgi:hypothetical protein
MVKKLSQYKLDSQSVKSAAMVSQSVGFDAGKKIKGRKRFMTVDSSSNNCQGNGVHKITPN